jgi:SAM-dependent methyltransferase
MRAKDNVVSSPQLDFERPVLSLRKLDRYLSQRSILEALVEQIPSFHGNLLDVGCGRMPYRALLLEAPSKVENYVGLDLYDSPYSLDQRPDVQWDGEKIPLESSSIDCAICTEVLIHCPDPEGVLRETARVLKPGGKLFFTVPFLWPIHDAPSDQYRLTPFALQRQLTNAGFVSIEMKTLGGWDAGLAQMIGLWVRRRQMPRAIRGALSILALAVMRILIKIDRKPNIPADFTSTMMITGICGTGIRRQL